MGQGAESCNGYEVLFDPHDEYLEQRIWTQRDGTTIHVSKMTLTHLKNVYRHVERLFFQACTVEEKEQWDGWMEVFRVEMKRRQKPTTPTGALTPKTPTAIRGKKQQMICHCGQEYTARDADLQRGWSLSCSKSCAAIRRDYGRPAAQPKP